ncbi:MAG: HI0074 family nucleotidyltransferase substrate-binding subunit [Acidobacteriota bacterium]
MDAVELKLEAALRALATLEELAAPQSKVERDAGIQRFEYTFEAAWKAAQAYLRQVEGVEAASPKRAIRESHVAGLLGEQQAGRALEMADDRNLTAHTYHEEVADAIAGKLGEYSALIRAWLEAMVAEP